MFTHVHSEIYRLIRHFPKHVTCNTPAKCTTHPKTCFDGQIWKESREYSLLPLVKKNQMTCDSSSECFRNNPLSCRRNNMVNLDVSESNGTPKSSILTGFSIINHPFGVPLFLETPICTWHKKCPQKVFRTFLGFKTSNTSLLFRLNFWLAVTSDFSDFTTYINHLEETMQITICKSTRFIRIPKFCQAGCKGLFFFAECGKNCQLDSNLTWLPSRLDSKFAKKFRHFGVTIFGGYKP